MKKFLFLLVSMLLSANFVASAVGYDYPENNEKLGTEQTMEYFDDEEIPLAKAYNKKRTQILPGFDGIRVYKRKYRTTHKKIPLIKLEEKSLNQPESKYKKCQNIFK